MSGAYPSLIGYLSTLKVQNFDVVQQARGRSNLGLAAVAATGSASDLTVGTLADARLSANVPLKNAANTFTGLNTFNGSITLASSSFIQRPDGNLLLGWDTGGDYVAAGSNAGTARPLGIGANHTQISIRTSGVTRAKIFGNGNFQIGDNTDNGALLQVLGTSNITGAAQFGSTLSVTGAASFSSTASINGILLKNAASALNIRNSSDTAYWQVDASGISVNTGGVQWRDLTTNSEHWRLYKNSSDPTLYLRDMVNARMLVQFGAGATSGSAFAIFLSNVNVDAALRVVSNDSYIGSSDTHNYLSNTTNFRGGGVTQAFINGATGAATFNGLITANGSITAGFGNVTGGIFNAQGTSRTGYYEWRKNGVRQGYVGYDDGNNISFDNEVGGYFTFFDPIQVGLSGNVLRWSPGWSAVEIRNSSNVNYGRLAVGDLRVTNETGGSLATPGNVRIGLMTQSLAYLAGAITGRTYSNNAVHGDVILSANSVINTGVVDYSNLTDDLVIRGNTGNVEINRGNLVMASTKSINMSTGANTFTTFMGGPGNYEGYQHFQTNGQTNFWVHSTGTISRTTHYLLGNDVNVRAFDSAVSYLRFYGTSKSDCELAGGTILRFITAGSTRATINATAAQFTIPIQLGSDGPSIQQESGAIGFRSGAGAYAQVRATEYRLDANSFSRVAQLNTSTGGWGGGYNFNVTGGTFNRDSTGTVNAVYYNVGAIQWFSETSGAPGVITPRMTLSPTTLAMTGAITATGDITATGRINSGNGTSFGESGVGNVIKGNDTYIQSADTGNHVRFTMTSASAGATLRIGWTTAHGGVSLESVPVASGQTGYLAWFKPSGTRQGYMGYDAGNDITLKVEQSGGQFIVDGVGARIGLSGPLLKNSSGTLQIRNGSDTNFTIAHVGQLRVGPNASTVFPIEADSYISTRVSTAIAVGFIATNSLSQWASQVSTGGDWEVMQYAPSIFRRLWVTQVGEVYTQNQITTASAVGNQSMRIRAIASQTGNLLQFLDVNGIEIGRVTTTANMQLSGHITSAFQSLSADPSTLDISSGMSRLVKNTTSGEIRHWVNDGGTMKKSAAYT